MSTTDPRTLAAFNSADDDGRIRIALAEFRRYCERNRYGIARPGQDVLYECQQFFIGADMRNLETLAQAVEFLTERWFDAEMDSEISTHHAAYGIDA